MVGRYQYRGVGSLTDVLRQRRKKNGTHKTGRWRTLTVYLDKKPGVK